jgi:hypothetical protein
MITLNHLAYQGTNEVRSIVILTTLVRETVATMMSYNHHGYGDEDASASNPKVRKNEARVSSAEKKERKEKAKEREKRIEKRTEIKCMLAIYEHDSGKFSNVVIEFGLLRCKTDHSVFHLHSDVGYIILLAVYVDDIVITRDDSSGIVKLKQFL